MLVKMKEIKAKSIVKKLVAMMLVMTLTMANFILITKETYAMLAEEILTAQTQVEGIQTAISNKIEKYLKVEEGVILQVELNIDLQKDAEQKITQGKIEIDVPSINGKLPTDINLVNITTAYKSEYSNSKLTITPEQIEGKTSHRIVYLYPVEIWEEGIAKSITWKTTISAKIDEKDYSIQNTENAEISNIGNEISTEISLLSEIYKGNMYNTEGRLETAYTENIEIETSYLSQTVENKLKLDTGIPQIINKDNSTSNANTYYISSKISKNYLKAIFADAEGKFEVKIKSVDENGQITEININQDTSTVTEDSTYILVVHPIKTVNISLESVSTIKTTAHALKIENSKILITDKSIDNIETMTKLEEKVTVNGNECKSQIELKEPTANATVQLKDINTISSVNGIQNIGIVITLQTMSTESDKLFENPTFKITMPDGVKIKDLESNTTISAENGNFTVKNAKINGDSEIYLELNGKQTSYVAGDINPQIILKANVEVAKSIANKSDIIKMEYINNGETYQTQSDVVNIIASNDKLITSLKLENYNGEGTIVEKYSDSSEEVTGELSILNEDVIKVPVKYTIINNYDIQITVENSIVANYKNYKDEETNLMNWYEKDIVVDARQVKTIEKELIIPAKLYYNEKINIEAFTNYNYSGTPYSLSNTINLATEEKDAIGDMEIVNDKFVVETLAQLGDGTVLTENDKVYNEQIIKYTIRIMNTSTEEITNINLTAKQENGKIYDLKEVIVTNPMIQEGEFVEHEYAELDTDTKIFTTSSLKPNESKEFIYRAVAKKPEQDGKTSTKLSISADNVDEVATQTVENEIIDAQLKITNKLAYHEEVEMQGGSVLPILTTVKNIGGSKIESADVRVYLSEGLIWNQASEVMAYQIVYDEEIQADIYEEIDTLKDIKYNAEQNYIEFKMENLGPDQSILIKSVIYANDIPTESVSAKESIYVKINDNVSNNVEVNIKQTKTEVTVKQSVNISENQKAKNGDSVIITGEITNTGSIASYINIGDYLHNGLEVQKVTLIRNGQSEDKTEISKNGIIDIMVEVTPKETVTITIETTVNTSRIITKEVENVITVLLNGGEKVESNKVVIQIYSEIDNGNGENEEGTYTISGLAWIDNNNNGIKDGNEGLSNIIVKIVDLNNKNSFLKDESGKEIEAKTNSNGEYKISRIPEGSYSIIFKYDTNKYELKENTSIKDYILIDNQEKVGITNNLELKENIKDINLQLIQLKKFNLKLDKYITSVVVQTSKETRTTKYDNQKLAKEEIASKYLVSSTVLVEYTMKITNIGELPGYVTELVDYLPEDMKFNSEINTQWYTQMDGKLYNSSLSSEIINPGESKEVKLVLIRNMTSENTGTITNNAKITKTANSREYVDIDLSNNESTAQIMITPATGGVFTYLAVVLNSMIIIFAGIYIIKKKVIK